MKVILSTIVMIFMFSSVSFCDEVSDLTQFSDSTNLTIKTIIDGKYDSKEVMKELNRDKVFFERNSF